MAEPSPLARARQILAEPEVAAVVAAELADRAAGAVPDTGQARESALSRYFAPDDPAEEPFLPAAVAFRAGWDRAVAASSPARGTVQAPDVAALLALTEEVLGVWATGHSAHPGYPAVDVRMPKSTVDGWHARLAEARALLGR